MGLLSLPALRAAVLLVICGVYLYSRGRRNTRNSGGQVTATAMDATQALTVLYNHVGRDLDSNLAHSRL
jgi:hypothetical protein